MNGVSRRTVQNEKEVRVGGWGQIIWGIWAPFKDFGFPRKPLQSFVWRNGMTGRDSWAETSRGKRTQEK